MITWTEFIKASSTRQPINYLVGAVKILGEKRGKALDLGCGAEENFISYNPDEIAHFSSMLQATKDYYKKMINKGERPHVVSSNSSYPLQIVAVYSLSRSPALSPDDTPRSYYI